MSDICDYLYVSGFRFKSGSVFVEVPTSCLKTLERAHAEGGSGESRENVRLRVVRTGKGASRVTRWADSPQRYGVTGEINLRDLSLVLQQQGLSDIDATVTLEGDQKETLAVLNLNPEAAMGRKGRVVDTEEMAYTLESLDNGTCQALIREQLCCMPYGMENSRAATERLTVLLQYIDTDSLKQVIRQGRVEFVKHITRAAYSALPETLKASMIGFLSEAAGVSIEARGALQEMIARRTEDNIENSDKKLTLNPDQLLKILTREHLASGGSSGAWQRVDPLVVYKRVLELSVDGNANGSSIKQRHAIDWGRANTTPSYAEVFGLINDPDMRLTAMIQGMDMHDTSWPAAIDTARDSALLKLMKSLGRERLAGVSESLPDTGMARYIKLMLADSRVNSTL